MKNIKIEDVESNTQIDDITVEIPEATKSFLQPSIKQDSGSAALTSPSLKVL